MFSATKYIIAISLCMAWMQGQCAPLRICADPNNLPYSNDQWQGFENEIAALFAKDLNMQLSYFWFPQREAFFRKTLQSGMCDVVMGAPVGLDEADVTRPYYRSTYVFVSRKDRGLHITSFDDPQLRTLKIGVHVLGEQDDSPPPVHALTSRGIVSNLIGFSIFGNLNEKDPPADLLRAVAGGQVDIAIVWGPLAGYFARHSDTPLEIDPVQEDPGNPQLHFAFDIGIGVRPGDKALKEKLDIELERRRADIDRILANYGIPQLKLPGTVASAKED